MAERSRSTTTAPGNPSLRGSASLARLTFGAEPKGESWRQEAMLGTGCRAGFQPAGSAGILPEVSAMMGRSNTDSRLEAAATGRQDACPTGYAHDAERQP